jgi:XRE family aerobic/anaerobic benzoate catabolism transcriptional regulator
VDILTRLPPSELPAIAAAMQERLGAAADRARRIALVGLRGAGKSTLGRKLAEHLGVPFLELNRVIEQNYGASAAMLIELSGLATFRKYEHECLQRVIAEHDAVVIATAGGIVSNPQTYELLLRRTHAIWIKARPEEHMARVIAQGDFRPMAHNREAMGDLVAILEARSADYARAESALDTSGASVEKSLTDLVRLVSPYAAPHLAP